MKLYDAIVVGAGPAGSTAACQIARRGFKALLLEKHERPGLPLCCAEGINASELKEALGHVIDPAWILTVIDRIRISSPDGNEVIGHSKGKGYILDRPKFDNDLAEMACRAGAELKCHAIGRNLKHENNSFKAIDVQSYDSSVETIGAKVFIAADGVESEIARTAGIDNILPPDEIMAGLQYRLHDVNTEKDIVEFHLGNQIAPGGYIWVFPKSDSAANVGICASAIKADGAELNKLLDRFIKNRFGNATVKARMCGLIPQYGGKRNLYKDNLLIVGDAGRIIESLSGAGISLAVLSGRFAGETAADYLDGKLANVNDLGREYVSKLMSSKRETLVRFAKLRRAFIHMTDDDFNYVIVTLRSIIEENKNRGISAGELLWTILKTHPKLIRLVRYLI